MLACGDEMGNRNKIGPAGGRSRKGNSYPNYRWLDPAEIVVAEWVRMKCLYGCREYGHNAACPPKAPPVAECARFFREYTRAAVFHFAKTVERPEDRHAWGRKVNLGLLKLEEDVFKAGFVKAFLLFFDSCGICLECASSRTACKEPKLSRPTPWPWTSTARCESWGILSTSCPITTRR
jgi:predicted metal-binding protein